MSAATKTQAPQEKNTRKKNAWMMRLAGWVFAVLFACILIVQGGLFAAVWWVNSQGGQTWLKAQIDTALVDSGYSVTFSGLQYRFMTSVSVQDLEVKAADVPYISADHIDLGIDVLPLAGRVLSLHARAGTIMLHASAQEKPQAESAPLFSPIILPEISIPDLYFTKFILDDISAEKLVLEDQAIELTPVISGEIHMLRGGRVKADFICDVGASYPHVTLKVLFNAPKSTVEIKELMIAMQEKKADISGEMQFTKSGKSSLRIVPHVPQMENGLLELDFENMPDGLDGVAKFSGSMDGEFVRTVLPMKLSGDTAQISAFEASGFGMDLGGDLVLNPIDLTLEAVLHKIEGVGVSLNGLSAKVQKQENDILSVFVKTKGMLHQDFSLDVSSLIDLAAQKIYDVDADITLGKGALRVSGAGDLNTLDFSLEAQNFPLEDLVNGLPPTISTMTVSTKTHLSGTPSTPILDSATQFSALQVAKNAPKISLGLDAAYRGGVADVKMTGAGKGINEMSGTASLPLALSLYPFSTDVSENTPIEGVVQIDADVSSLVSAFLPPDQSLRGKIKVNGTLNGKAFAPNIAADIILSKGAYQNKSVGFGLNDIELVAALTPDALSVASLKATDGEGGRLDASGKMLLDASDVDFSLKAADMHLLKGDLADGMFNADVTLKGSNGAYKVGGEISPQKIVVNIPETYSTSIPELNIVKSDSKAKAQSPITEQIEIDMRVNAPNQIFVRGWGLDAEFGGELDISGRLDAPLFDGTLKSLRGRYSEFGKNFEISRANMKFSGTIPPNPVMDILAETKADEIMAQISITGALSKPEFGFSSVPALPQDEVLAHILFGKNMDNISPMQAAQLAQTIRRFSGKGGGGGLDPLGLVRGVTGLDDIRVDTDGEGGASVGAGKYITDKVYLEFESGAEQGSGGATLEIEVTPNINIESKVGQNAQGGAGLFWEHDY